MVSTQELAVLIISGMLFTFFLGFGIILFAQKNRKIQELSDQLLQEEKAKNEVEKLQVALETQETERGHIARMLHDDVGAILSLAQKNILFIQKQAKAGVFEHNSIEVARDLIQESINQLRQINKGLIPHYLLKFGLVKALERMGTQKTAGFIQSFNFETQIPHNLIVSEQIMTQFFYVTSELITNLLKHSFPTIISMALKLEGNQLLLIIKHDGIALSQRDYVALSKESENLGLENIRYRLNLINGELTFKRNATQGEITIAVSIENVNS